MLMDMPFFKEDKYKTPKFLERDGNLFRTRLLFSGIFLGRVVYSRTWNEMVIFYNEIVTF